MSPDLPTPDDRTGRDGEPAADDVADGRPAADDRTGRDGEPAADDPAGTHDAQLAQVRRILAAAPDPGPMPTHVAARLDAALTALPPLLRADGAAGPADDAGRELGPSDHGDRAGPAGAADNVTPLAKHRARSRQPWLLAAAAAAGIALLLGPPALDALRGSTTTSDSTASGAGTARRDAATPPPAAGEGAAAEQYDQAPSTLAGPEAGAQPGPVPGADLLAPLVTEVAARAADGVAPAVTPGCGQPLSAAVRGPLLGSVAVPAAGAGAVLVVVGEPVRGYVLPSCDAPAQAAFRTVAPG